MSDPLEELETTTLRARYSGSDDYADVLIDAGYDAEWLSGYKWTISRAGYVCAPKDGFRDRDMGATNRVYLHHLILPPKEGYWRQFKNGDKLDCRSCNVIYRTPKDSARLRHLGESRKGKFGYVGVAPYFNRNGDPAVEGRYRAKHHNGYLGVYSTPEEAARAHDQYVIETGANSRLNFPDEIEQTKNMELHPMGFGHTHLHQKRTKPLNFVPKTTPRPPIGKDYLWAVRKGEAFKILLDPEDVDRLKDYYFFIKKGGQVAHSTTTRTGGRSSTTIGSLILPGYRRQRRYLFHKNGNPLDFRKENLVSEVPRGPGNPARQLKASKINLETGYIGVKYQLGNGRINKHAFVAYVGAAYLGTFRNPKDAAMARDRWVKKWRPELELNFEEGEQ